MPYKSERARRESGDDLYLVVDAESFEPHPEARDYSLYLTGRDFSINTVRSYIAKLAAFLSWCQSESVDWRTISMADMVRYRWYVESPKATPKGPRSPSTVAVYLGATIDFLRFCGRAGFITPEVAGRLVEPKYLRHATHDTGERGEYRSVLSPALRVNVPTHRPKYLEPDQIAPVLDASSVNLRDNFLIRLLLGTGIRVGEALGLRREDMHLLPSSAAIGCPIKGAHIHVERRLNPNGALAKTRPRPVPVPDDVARAYSDYQFMRTDILGKRDVSDFVFVNLWRGEVGEPMTYATVGDLFLRLSHRSGVRVRPHMLRHTAATTWIRQPGTELDVVQDLLGHRNTATTKVYLHRSDDEKRQAVLQAAAYLAKETQR